jgi:acrylyl-CoA reductase (NADPH)
MSTFKALLLEKNESGVTATLKELAESDLPAGEVLVSVAYSTLNYKDGLTVTNSAPVVRQFPLVPGIDLAGTVEASTSAAYQPGDGVILTGWGVGELYWGGLAQKARVKADWLVPLPTGLTLQNAMALGTAGFTAMLAVMALESHHVTPDKGEVVVTGAAGGVGSVAIAMLAKLGYTVVASTGRVDGAKDYLMQLGASRVMGRFSPSKRALDKELWAGAVDTVGGETLAAVTSQTIRWGSVAVCGMAGGGNLPATVYPFILRGVNLLGIDSVMSPVATRQIAWQRLTETMTPALLELITERIIGLTEVPTVSQQIMQGQVRGRVVVDVNR